MMIRLVVVAVAVAALVASPASAVLYEGMLSTEDGTLTGTDEWVTGLTTFTYAVDNVTTPGYWHYVYTLTIPTDTKYAANIQHLIIGVTSGLTMGDLKNVSGQLHKVELVEAKGDNANMPQDLYAAVFQVGGEESFVTIRFDTTRAPVWGDFFARGDNQNSIWNIGFTADSVDPTTVPPDVCMGAFILRPDSIPEPTTMLTLLAGLAFTRVFRRRPRGV